MSGLPDPNTVGWWALKDGTYVEFVPSARFADADEAGPYFFDRHGHGVTFHHGNRAGLRATASTPDTPISHEAGR